ncbi:MAG TPA: prepilin-type N-terminal cleavage/methylation domain-containing protein [Planctomycetota bacterium]|nr:prepilin-type N-terminal cleavage/methylation domain-containing protein [Planctomycetota bacterium]
MSQRRGFTLIELLVVILIIVILIALLVPTLSHLRRKGRITNTMARMQQVCDAISNYIQRYDTLGDPSAQPFMETPYQFLHARYVRNDEEPLINIPLNRLAKGSGPYLRAESSMEAEQILDEFPNGYQNVLRFEVDTKPVHPSTPNRTYIAAIRVYSSLGVSNDDVTDDMLWMYTKEKGEFWCEQKGK